MAKTNRANSKGCGSQPLPKGEPTQAWGFEDLRTYSQKQFRQIIEGEKRLAPSYWRLGHALELAKGQLNHGQWGHFLKELGIDKTRASKARAIYRAFPDVADLQKLTVEEAYNQRSGKEGASDADAENPNSTAKEAERVRKSIEKIAKQSGDVVHDAAFAGPDEAAVLIPSVRKAIEELRQLLHYLEAQAASKE